MQFLMQQGHQTLINRNGFLISERKRFYQRHMKISKENYLKLFNISLSHRML